MRRFQTALGRIKNKKGVTLVELIMVMAIMAILGVAVMTLTTSSLGMYNKGRDLITKEEVAKIVEGYVSAKVEKAITVKISSDKKSVDVTSKAGSAKIGTKNSEYGDKTRKVLANGGNAVFGSDDEASEKAIYGKFSVELKFEKEGENVLLVTVTVFETGNASNAYVKTFSPLLLNAGQEDFSLS